MRVDAGRSETRVSDSDRLSAIRIAATTLVVAALAACAQDTVGTDPDSAVDRQAALPGEGSTDGELEELRLRIGSAEQPGPVVEGGLTGGEMNLLAREIERSWSLPVEALEPPELAVELRVWMNRDGTVQRVQVVDGHKLTTSSSLRALAESAIRAVMNCVPLTLPPEKYDQWKVLVLTFDASHIVQG